MNAIRTMINKQWYLFKYDSFETLNYGWHMYNIGGLFVSWYSMLNVSLVSYFKSEIIKS